MALEVGLDLFGTTNISVTSDLADAGSAGLALARGEYWKAGFSVAGVALVVGGGAIFSKLAKNLPGEELFVGTYNQAYRGNKNAKRVRYLVPYHIVQDAVSETSRGKGATINTPRAVHKNLLSTNVSYDRSISLRTHLARDLLYLRKN